MTSLMTRRTLMASALGLGVTACTTADQEALLGILAETTGGTSGVGLTQAEAAAGIRAALNNGIGSAISTVGRNGGYLNDGIIRIPLPGFLGETQTTLARFGLSGALDNLQVQLNRGAEAAAPVARDIFVQAVSSLSIQDAIGIVRGPSNAATQYLQRTTTPRLTSLFRPIMVNALQQAGAIQTYDNLVASMRNIPLAPQYGADAKDQLIDHGVSKGLDGVFYYIGQEEAAIRRDPVKRTSEILRRVFG
ncbi:DUF4197 domain-containing protein [Parvularcula sp. IMCC14364]|uniref:DUF4197 domain-containing protein n=1 Tax=Parvularcula sp. IMCC14364 TaxID=3067902 RepID=UPI002741780E|nr:DUF4197 domain-containing protein [Parvularcula sp. IMCC14364]